VTNRISPAPEEPVWIARIGPGMKIYSPCRCWAETKGGTRCQKWGAATWQPVDERVPYALCAVHAKVAELTPERLVLLAPGWDRAAEQLDGRIRRTVHPLVRRFPVWQRY
jgi:hypothetical protein